MCWRPPALAASLMLATAAVLVSAAPAPAQTCQPPSAEEAFEELLDLATDDSPVEDKAWRIADEQEAREAFETPETIQKIDALAQANGFVFDCARRLYVPVSGPDPRVAIENGEEPAEPDGEQPAEEDGEPGSTAPAPGGKTAAPGQAGAAPDGTVTDGTPGTPAGPDGEAAAATAGGAAAGDRPGTAPRDVWAEAATDVAAPGDAPGGEGGVVVLPSDSGSPAGRTVAVTLLLGAGAIATVVTAARAKRAR